MKKICVVTATRAEYGLLRPVIKELKKEPNFDTRIVVTGAHLSHQFGLTYKEIIQDGIIIDEKIEMLLDSDTPSAISKSMGLALIGFSDYFKRENPDLLIVLGDRYETLAVSIAAMNHMVPIAHMHGGEITEGAIDESIRHAITKFSHIHFTSTEEYKKRVIQLGEQPNSVYSVGATGVENILKRPLLSKKELEKSMNFKLDKPYVMITYHPVTLEKDNEEKRFKEILKVCADNNNFKFIFTKANADAGGRIINQMIDSFVENNANAISFTSMGIIRYLSSLKYCSFVMGNSSSGIIEAPSFGIPTINIGNRQKGRIQAESVINCKPSFNDIKHAFNLALSDDFRVQAKKTENPYGDGATSSKIVKILKENLLENSINLRKSFYNM